MPTIRHFLLALLFSLSCVAATAADTQVDTTIPIQIFATRVELRKGLTRSDLKPTLSSIIKDAPSVDNAERLQYDVQLIAEAAPVTFIFDFDRKGLIKYVAIDSYMKSQNPAVTNLLSWLNSHAGKPNLKRKGKIVWNNFNGWKIEHVDQGSGEDSVYRIELSIRK